ncbi:MAG: N-acetylmuramoyl-L-alanine amidase [Vulcanococcus sp.]
MVRQFLGDLPVRQRPFWIGAAGLGALMLLGGITLVCRELWRDQPAAMAPAPPAKAPAPPAQAPWVSPLHRQCSVADTALQRRLERLQQQLPQRTERLRIAPSNYGPRLTRDAYGQAIPNRPQLVVLHETVYGLTSAINTFITNHADDNDQVSYHMLIGEKGRIVQVLDPDRRAFGAGYSAFRGRWAITNPAMAGSVNNFALHLSLETPLDGEDDAPTHSGYSSVQYDAMAVVLADWMRRYGIPAENITTHRHVDLGLERADPRSFDWQALQVRLAALGMLC